MLDLVKGVVEVRRHPDAGAGTMIDDDAAPDQLGGDGLAIGHVDDDGAAALSVGLGRIDPEAGIALYRLSTGRAVDPAG